LETICTPGSYCINGLKLPCPPGLFGNVTGLRTVNCSGPCQPGQFCPQGSVTPLPCPKGTYGAVEKLTNSSCSGRCQQGYFCPEGSISPRERPCPPGRYGPVEGLSSYDCSNVCESASDEWGGQYCIPNYCEAGYFCPAGSSSAQQNPCGSPSLYCPTGVALPLPVEIGFYSIGRISIPNYPQIDTDANARTGQELCEAGFYCSDGVRYLCPAGTYGSALGLSNASCSGDCLAGYYCEEGSSSPMQYYCGGPAYYCPRGSSYPTLVPSGYYSYSTDGSPITRDSILPCLPGHYCVDGVKRPCPDGYYSVNGSTSAFCDGECDVTQYCPAGTSTPSTVIF
jgi:hypothetical protein